LSEAAAELTVLLASMVVAVQFMPAAQTVAAMALELEALAAEVEQILEQYPEQLHLNY
jgi:hypothetical protein